MNNIKFAIIIILSRLIPHLANISPINSLCLFAGSQFSLKRALMLILISTLISDIALSYINHYPIFGIWSIFTYTGFIGIILLGKLLRPKADKISQIIPCILICTLSFWIWTNLGVWCLTPFYAHNVHGLLLCYQMALPFLRNALIGDVLWSVFIFLGFNKIFLSKREKIFKGLNS